MSPRQIIRQLRERIWLWLIPAAAIAAAAAVYTALREPTWEASQALIVRNEAFNASKEPGKFSYPEEMKTVQETILEVLKSRGVLRSALVEVGPPPGCKTPEQWPTEEDVAEARKNVKLVPPKGAEFGKTEVFYLDVRAQDRARSVTLNEALFKRLQGRFKQLRDAKAESMVDELTKTVRLAKADLDQATAALASTEQRLGSDLAELRSMQEMASSDSALRRSGEEIRAQLRENAVKEKINRQLLEVVSESQGDPIRLASAPNQLLESHPSLRRLKDGLIEARLRTASLLGTMSADNPKVQVAVEAEEEIARKLHEELAVARRGIEVELRLCADRRELLDEQLVKTNRRLQGLAEVRAVYANQVASVKNRAVLLERAEGNLAEARAARASAKATSLLSPIDVPDAGIRPVGPGRFTIVLCGLAGGLLAGFGLVLLTVPVGVASGKPETTADGNGRMASRLPGANGSAKPRASVGGRFTVKRALQRLAK